MKKTSYILFLVLFLVLCLLPLAGLAVTGPAEAAGNELLALTPSLKTDEGKLNLDYLSDVNAWFGDHFSCRQELINLDAEMEAGLLGESAEEKVVLGKEGWLYYSSTLDDYQGSHRLTERQVWAAAHTLSMLQAECERSGAKFLFTVAPNKNTLYPEHMPGKYGALSQESSLKDLAAALEEAGVPYLDLVALLSQEDRTLYHRLDSHWTGLGAALARDGIMDAFELEAAPFYDPEQFTLRKDFDADLYRMLYPTGTELDEEAYPVWDFTYEYTSRFRNAEELNFTTACPGRTGSLFLFRDSFGNALHQYLAESFGTASFSRAMPYVMSKIPEGTECVVIEIVQRNLPWLCTEAPEMLAPEAELDLPETVTAQTAEVTSYENDLGWFVINGTLNEAPDRDSPIWILAEGTVYEAFPAGEGENPFTAALPELADQIQILYVQNGTLLLSQEIPCH